MPDSIKLLSLDLPCDRSAPGVVRRALRENERLGPFLRDGVLVASELVANAVVHSGGAIDQRIRVRAELSEDRLRISVQDPGLSGRDAVPASLTETRTGGRGLQIVDQLADRWGADRPDGYRVWAEVVRSAEPVG
jgi:anti-sigma regulatory factor (Ser/Thr protein kinase)